MKLNIQEEKKKKKQVKGGIKKEFAICNLYKDLNASFPIISVNDLDG